MNPANRSVFFMLCSVFFFSLANYFVKTLTASFSEYQILLFRSIPMLLICIYAIQKQKISFWGNQKLLLVIRSLVGAISVLLFYAATKKLDVGVAVTIRYLAPIFSIFFAIIILKNKLQPVHLMTTILAFFGIALVVGFSSSVNLSGFILIFLSALTLGFSYVLISKIGSKDASMVIVFYLSFFCIIVGGLFSIFNWNPISTDSLPSILLVGLSSFFAQYFLTKAFQIGDARKIAPIKYFEIFATMGFGFIFLGENYQVLTIIGALVLIFSLTVTFLDMDKNGTLNRADFETFVLKLDVNNDGKIDHADFKLFFQNLTKKKNKKTSED